jgi:putative transcriptional regulator
MSLESFRDSLAERRRSALFLFYVSALVSAMAITLVEKVPSLRTILLALAIAGAGIAILFLLRFLRSNVFLAVSMKTRLRVLRAEKEWSQAELAAQVGVARGTINALETGKYDPSLPLAIKIARVFGKTVEEVFLYPEGQDQARSPRV